MILRSLDARTALAFRAFGLVLVCWTVVDSSPHPAASGRGLLIAVLTVLGALAWLAWGWQAYTRRRMAVDLFVLAAVGGLLVASAPRAAGSVFAFVSIPTAAFRLEFARSVAVTALALFALALGVLVYDQAATEVLVYGLGFIAVLLAGANGRQTARRAEEAELRLAQAQRAREGQLRTAQLEESSRIAREIHDVLAHALAGLTIQLEATSSLLESGAERAVVLERLRRAHALAREGLEETRRAVGVLRGESLDIAVALRGLLAEYRASAPQAEASLSVDGETSGLSGPSVLAVVRVVQEALTNVRKHAPGASLQVSLDVGAAEPGQAVLLVRDDGASRAVGGEGADELAGSGGGYGLRGMRERAEILGGSLSAGPALEGWRVELRLPLSEEAMVVSGS